VTGHPDHQEHHHDAQQDDPDDPPRVAHGARWHARHQTYRVPGGGRSHPRSIGGVGFGLSVFRDTYSHAPWPSIGAGRSFRRRHASGGTPAHQPRPGRSRICVSPPLPAGPPR
jgi:hypothetical protein